MAIVEFATTSPVIDRGDVVETTYRASGAGGQHRNKTDSCVRLHHLPTRTIVCAERSRSQHDNRAAAWAELERRLREVAEREAHASTNAKRVEQIERRESRSWTWNEKAGLVTRHADGRTWPVRLFAAGRASL